MNFINKASFICLILLISFVKTYADSYLIIPGVSAENISINQTSDSILSQKGYPDKVSEFKNNQEVLNEVLGCDVKTKIIFNKIYYYKKDKLVLFLKDGKVCAIAGLENNRITPDSVNLNKGIEYFIFNYGNNDLEVISDKDNRNRIFIYNTQGIALIDDNCDNSVDMYIIFASLLK